MKITHADMLAFGMCNRGARPFCLRHGINWMSFIQHGIDESEVAHIDDAMLHELIEFVRKRHEVNNG